MTTNQQAMVKLLYGIDDEHLHRKRHSIRLQRDARKWGNVIDDFLRSQHQKQYGKREAKRYGMISDDGKTRSAKIQKRLRMKLATRETAADS